ncbi:hypothetical protein PILCRDRAFT_14564 [Piloderma croceum F 1598]|uniref:Uncharacterized protein n=1 Tax=Piloderma croceum (strain F 1598) TaxID=765440 RepID=A0A0C3F2Z0_PILCF|nr:hypothetical protein PILCRDRAFT_14564 [Piloderma croceum F 1598]
MSDLTGDNMEDARLVASKLSSLPIVNEADGVTNLASTVSNQTGLATSLRSLLGKVEMLVKIGDEVTKIHPYVNFAWQVLSLGFKMVQVQQHQDQRILDLITTMEDTYLTLAYQLAVFDDSIGAEISWTVEIIPQIAEMPLDFQFTNLLSAQALKWAEWSKGPVVMALSKGFLDLPSFMRVIVVSQPETDIEDTLTSHEAVHLCRLDIDSATTQEDISEFLRHRFSYIRRKMRHSQLNTDWPSDDKIRSLTNSTGGLFVWVLTACLYIQSHDPDEWLNELITQQSKVDSSRPFVQLDRLYKTGLQSAGLWDNDSFHTDCCSIFGATLCTRIPLSHSMIDSLLALPRSQSSLESISCLGCGGKPWSIDLELYNKMLTHHCIQFLDNTLRENICGLTLLNPVQNESPSEAMSYACKFWVEHICLITHATDGIEDLIYEFLGWHLLHLMEALAVLKSHSNTIQLLQNLLDWLQKSSPTHTDHHQLVVKMLPPLQGHNSSILSVAFSPDGSKIISGSVDKTIRIWDVSTGVKMLPLLQGHNEAVYSVAFSPDGSKIVSGSVDKTI